MNNKIKIKILAYVGSLKSMLNNIKNFINKNRKDLFYVLILIGLLLVISIPRLMTQYNISIANWDTYLYLENGRNFAKMGWGDVPSIAPVLPMIISKFFLMAGHTYPTIIFTIDVVFYIMGVVGLYLLFRYKFDYNTALLGSIIYATFTLLYSWVSIGGNDIIGVTGTILTIYLVLVANKYDNRLYLLAFPIAAYSFLSRYTAGVMLFSIIFFLIINKIEKKELKYIIIGLIAGIISIAWFLNNFYERLGTAFPFLEQFSGTVQNTPVMDSGYLPDVWYYIKHIPNYLSSTVPDNSFNSIVNPMGNVPTIFSYVLIVLFIMGALIVIYKILTKITQDNKSFLTKKNMIILFITLVLAVISVVTLNNISYIITTILFTVILILLYYLLDCYNIEYLDYEFMMILLLLSYLVFQSILSTKNDRYFITVLPFIAYFITCSISQIYDFVDKKLKNNKIKVSSLVSIILIIFLMASSLSFNDNIPTDNHYDDIEEACIWLKNYDPSINNYTIMYSDNWPAIGWYFNVFTQRGVPEGNNSTSIWKFSKYILSQNNTHYAASYYIDTNSDLKADYPGLTKIYQKGDVVIYENSYNVGIHPKKLNTTEYKQYINQTLENSRGEYIV
ncbi:MAG: glycosyltransferase family 39 protein [Methanosphaera stadtmanae]|nr:glycosyltransferase family 39 protein [Methanosphaera stadtmanae]